MQAQTNNLLIVSPGQFSVDPDPVRKEITYSYDIVIEDDLESPSVEDEAGGNNNDNNGSDSDSMEIDDEQVKSWCKTCKFGNR